jgi:hypothetical protein
MTRFAWTASAVLLAACTAEAPAPADHGRDERACAAAVAAHVGKPVEAVSATWSGATAAGGGVVTVADAEGAGGERVHTCEVDAAGNLIAIRHPGA